MIRDPKRSWTSTHTVFGLGTNLYGQASKEKNQRLTKSRHLDRIIESFDNVQCGTCLVRFNKNDIVHITWELEKHGHEVAMISMMSGKLLLLQMTLEWV
ncbi:unnamed protein product [Adineta ricciae]|uniref:Uncharacterized protein n=1 Tax=Adineta ricciae TaxID=249248 RepID=A0A816BDD5_ADIRI|nr:unnamed protein product [Adineta ricciae]